MRYLRILLFVPALLLLWQWTAVVADGPLDMVARGRVFQDNNGDGKFDEGDRPMAGVRVSNGQQIVATTASGEYELPVDRDTIIFVIKPRGYRTPISEHQLPRFYYIHKPNGSPKSKYAGVSATGELPQSIDFPLYEQHEPEQFKALMFGDPQPRNQEEIEYIAHDVVEELVGTDASFGVTLGDIMFDNLDLFEESARTIAVLGIPWYNVIGNHDINLDAKKHDHVNETYERVFGPSYYSFDYGPVHFLVVDDIEWLYSEETGKGRYRGGLTTRQLEFIRRDLELIPKNQLVVLMMHIPLVDIHNRQELYRLIEQRPFCMSISGHTHYHEHRFITGKDGWRGPEPHHHVINVTVSGSWWSGAPTERGIPHTMMKDGAPNGYSIISFDGTNYDVQFKAAGYPDDYQMRIAFPEAVAQPTPPTPVFVNVFNGSERSDVEFRLDGGPWTKMKQVREADPVYVQIVEADKKLEAKTYRDLPAPMKSGHLWKSDLSGDVAPGTHLIEVKAVDMHGKTHWGRRVFRVTPAAPTAAVGEE